MLTAVRPTSPRTQPASAPRVANPHAPEAPGPADDVQLSAPSSLSAAAESAAAPQRGRTAALAAAGLAAVVLTGVMAPVLGGLINSVPPDAISQTVSIPVAGGQPIAGLPGAVRAEAPAQTSQPAAPAQTQDPAALVAAMVGAAEQSAQALPQANQVHAQWTQDLTAMQATTADLAHHVDALMRDSKTDAAAHHAAIDSALAKLGQQAADLQTRMAKEQPGVDKFLGQNRDNLNQIGTISFNLERNVDQAASQYGYFTPERQALRQLGSEVHTATKDLAMATERTTTVRANDKALADNMKAVQQLVAQVQKAADGSKTSSSALSTVDNGARVLQNAFKILGQVSQQSQQDVDQAAALSHQGAADLGVVFHSLGGGQAQAQPPQ